eukprot:scaffold2574_cov168-Amphora_coffeaeformis.AAC.1
MTPGSSGNWLVICNLGKSKHWATNPEFFVFRLRIACCNTFRTAPGFFREGSTRCEAAAYGFGTTNSSVSASKTHDEFLCLRDLRHCP